MSARGPDAPHVLVACLDPGIRWTSPKGAAVHLRSIAAGFADAGARVSILTVDGLASPSPAPSPRFDAVPGASAIRAYHRDSRHGRTSTELRALALNPMMLAAATALHERDPLALVYERFSLWSDVGARLAVGAGIPFVVEVNAPLLREQARYRRLALEPVARELTGRVLRDADRVIAVSRALARELEADGIAPDRIRHLPNVADPGHFHRAPFEPPPPGAPLRLGFSGSLKPWHGLTFFLEALARARRRRPRLQLEVLGDGRERDAVEATIRSLDLDDAVRLTGHVSHDEVPVRMAAWHAAIAPYPALDDFYFSPLKIVEAMAAGRPVLASSVGEIPELLGDGSRGRLLPPGDLDAWEAALVSLADDPGSLTALAEASVAHTRSWSWTAQARRSVEGLLPLPLEGTDASTPV